jgi:probable F420-dependent oxidoreductase
MTTMGATRPQFGLAVGAFSAGIPGPGELADLARLAEAVGFDSLQVGDHIQWHAPILESTTLMATFAAVTHRVQIASDVIILPLRDPVLMAKTVASLDVLSGGRVVFGVGVGGENPAEYEAMRIPRSERGARANECLEIVRGLLEHDRFAYAGRHYRIPEVAIAPRPLRGRVPVWVGGTSEAALRRAARYGDGWIGAFASERKFARLAGEVHAMRAAAGRAAGDFTLGLVVFINVDDTVASARETAARYVERVYRLPGDSVVERFGVTGPVEACADRLQAYLEAGVQYVVLSPVCGYRAWPRQVEAYGQLLRRLGGGEGR